MASVQDLLNKYATVKPAKAETSEDKGRVTVGNVFCQPTKNGANHKFCYWGVKNTDGSFIAGFTMANSKVLEMVQTKRLPKDFLATFEAFADKYVKEGKTVL